MLVMRPFVTRSAHRTVREIDDVQFVIVSNNRVRDLPNWIIVCEPFRTFEAIVLGRGFDDYAPRVPEPVIVRLLELVVQELVQGRALL